MIDGCLCMQVHKGVIFRPRSDTVEIGRYLVPGTVVYTLNEPYAESYPHFLNVTYTLVSGNVDGTFGFLEKNSTVGEGAAVDLCGECLVHAGSGCWVGSVCTCPV